MKTADNTAVREPPIPRPLAPELPRNALLTLAQVLQYIPVSRASWFKGVASGMYPKPQYHGSSTFWHSRDIAHLIEHGPNNIGAKKARRARPVRPVLSS
jgi:prophage regulatory protein